jgi:hypothetical protein
MSFLEKNLEEQTAEIDLLEKKLEENKKEKESEKQKRNKKEILRNIAFRKGIKKYLSSSIQIVQIKKDEDCIARVNELIDNYPTRIKEYLELENHKLTLELKTLQFDQKINKETKTAQKLLEQINGAEERITNLKDYLESKDKIQSELNINESVAISLIKKAEEGGELDNSDYRRTEWVKNRLLPNCVFIEKEEYTKMCISALKIVPSLAATDFGASRQRDLGQLWADTIRGYLGEFAFKKFLEEHWNVNSSLGHDKGELSEYLPLDIHQITLPGMESRRPNINIGIKTTKFSGIWLDIGGDQFKQCDIHIFVKIGIGRDHLFAFFKEISVFKDKILKLGEEKEVINEGESADIFNNLPTLETIPAYICGFARQDQNFENLSYAGKKGSNSFTIHHWNGPIFPGDIEEIKTAENVTKNGKVLFSGIGEFSHEKGYLFNSGSLFWKKSDWDKVIAKI